jgi:colanic acid/amylovoran biosynthesis glycosyltransferase
MIAEYTSKPVVGHFIRSYLFLTGSWIYHQLTHLSRYRPIVLTPSVENLDQFPFNDIYRYRQPFAGRGYLRIGLQRLYEKLTRSRHRFYVNTLRDTQACLLHAHFGTEGFYNLKVQQAAALPMITTFYGSDVSKLPKSRPKWCQRYRQLFERGTLFLAEGPYLAQSLVDLGCPADKVIVQHLGVNVDSIEFMPRTRSGDEPVDILMAASFREKKGIPYAVQAFVEAVKSYPDLELRIVGGAKSKMEQQLLQHCQQIAAQEQVADKVHFLGYVPYSQYLHEVESAHLFLSPSVEASNGDTEGGAPVAVIEASAAGIPVIATRHCDIPEVIVDGKSGLLVGERDVPALSKAILGLATSPEVWPTMGRYGRARVEAEFDIRKQVGRLEDIYDYARGARSGVVCKEQ